MDFRHYDNALGRFLCIDALSEKNHYLSPYNFADGNPVFFADPSGLDSDMPDWLQDLWDATPNGYNATWTNTGNGNFTVTAFWGSGQTINQTISSGSSDGGGGIAGFGIGTVYNTNTGSLTTVAGISYINFGNGINSSGVSGWQIFNTILLNEIIVTGSVSNINSSNATAQVAAQIYGLSGNDSSGFLGYWNKINDFNDKVVSPVVGIFEAGAIRAGTKISTANAFNKVALAETMANAKILKVAGNISRVGNGLGLGYSAIVAYNNPTDGNKARLVAQGTIIVIEVGVNSIVPGLGFVVGFGLSMFEQSDYMQEFYNGLDK